MFYGVSKMNDTLRSRIFELREDRKWTQEDLAKKLQVDLKTVYHWECGNTSPSEANIIQLSKLFMVSADYLLGLKTNNALLLDDLSEKERNRIVAMFQAYLNFSDSTN